MELHHAAMVGFDVEAIETKGKYDSSTTTVHFHLPPLRRGQSSFVLAGLRLREGRSSSRIKKAMLTTEFLCQIFEMDSGGVGVMVRRADKGTGTIPFYRKIRLYQRDAQVQEIKGQFETIEESVSE